LGDKAGMLILILGGTTEASALAAALADRPGLAAVVSLAGRTSAPKPLAVPTRIGGFGGVAGLMRWLQKHGAGAVVDATHPYAAVMARHAAEACATLGIPFLALRRPPWRAQPGDRWTEVTDMAEAAQAIGPQPRRVFLTVGRLELDAFAAAPQHSYLVRTIEPLEDALALPRLTAIRDRGPFDAAAEEALMRREGIEVLVTKNSGGTATYGKIAAARALGLPVIVAARPHKPEVASVERPEEVLAWIAAHLETHGRSPVLRGV
jgi:precorrin-6A/cobalt-precorrin-6A reductase